AGAGNSASRRAKRESMKINALDARLRGHDDLFSGSLGKQRYESRRWWNADVYRQPRGTCFYHCE
ncbi:MAG: hypothetical protein CVU17_09175, partial [Betaproteobacteria bacterium HGW-Betaproteobacteria-11]